ncbi:hypothetical protein D3C78_1764360 [compost metagenome]
MGNAAHAGDFDQSQDQVQLKGFGKLSVIATHLQGQLTAYYPVVGHRKWQTQQVVQIGAWPQHGRWPFRRAEHAVTVEHPAAVGTR